MNTNQVIIGCTIVILLVLYYFNKESFETVDQQKQIDHDLNFRPHVYTNQIEPAKKSNNEPLTKAYMKNLFNEYKFNTTPNGANVTVEQNKYDLIFKDILVGSEKRNMDKYPNPNNYSIFINTVMNKIYKAELIDVYVPAATDDAINIPLNSNRLYFNYSPKYVDCSGNPHSHNIDAYTVIMAGTYLNPETISKELTRQFNIVLSSAGLKLSKTLGINVVYDKNLNRYIFSDRNVCDTGALTIYPTNGTIFGALTVTSSMCDLLMLNYSGPAIYPPYVSGPKYINSLNNILFVDNAEPGDYGDYNGNDVSLKADCVYSNCIISEVVLTSCKIFLSLGKLDGDTCTIIPDQCGNSTGNVPQVFCQVPNNSCVSSSSVKTLLNQPSFYSSIQFYNPPISKLHKLDIKWYTETGTLIRILDHCFTVRIYYFQKRIDTTDFSFPIP